MPFLESHYKKEYLYFIASNFDNFPINVRVAGLSEENPDYANRTSPTNSTYNCHQMEYVVDGRGFIETPEGKFTVSKGDFFFVRKGQYRVLKTDKNNPFTKYYIAANGFLMDALLLSYGIKENLIIENIDLKSEFKKIFETVKFCPSDMDDGKLCDILGLIVIEIIQKLQRVRNPHLPRHKEDTALLIQDYIDLNINHNISLDDLCNHFHLGKTQLIEIFRKKHHCTPMHYHQKKKINAAKDYLLIGGTKTSEVVELLGFSDALYFSKVFKKHTGMTLTEYKKLINSNK